MYPALKVKVIQLYGANMSWHMAAQPVHSHLQPNYVREEGRDSHYTLVQSSDALQTSLKRAECTAVYMVTVTAAKLYSAVNV